MLRVLEEACRVLCHGGRIAINAPLGYGRPGNGGDRAMGVDWTAWVEEVGFTLRGHIIWDKVVGASGMAWGSWRSPSDPSLRDGHEIIIVAYKGNARRSPPLG